MSEITREWATSIQTASIAHCLWACEILIRRTDFSHAREIKTAFLNRACELTCVPLAQYYVETSSGTDLVWVTYRPEAIPGQPECDPASMIYLGSVDTLTEDQARSRAIGY